ncbi:MAG TPA: tetratricopeptide repeat protein [Gemmatimonadaceae bacterium]|nr:tetratricopeptide repeat protein [Gemmatimonadaceae bacterium]
MSVIQDALKRAQRERRRRLDAAESPMPTAVLVPLRANPSTFSWARSFGVGVAGALVIAVIVVGLQVRESARRPALPAVPPAATADLIVTPTLQATPRPSGRLRSVYENQPPLRSASTQPINPAPVAAEAAAPDTLGLTSRPLTRMQEPVDPATVSPQGQPRETSTVGARGALRIAVERPRNAEAAQLFMDAVIAHRNDDVANARLLYEKALALTPDDPDLLNNLGVLYSSQHEIDRAIDLLRKAVSLAPGNAGAWTNLGYALREAGRSADAVIAFQRALTLDPKRPAAQISLAQQYIAMGSIQQARDVVNHVIAADSTSAEAYYTLGQVLEMVGDKPGAIQAYGNFLRLAPPRLSDYSDRVRHHLDTLGARGAAR